MRIVPIFWTCLFVVPFLCNGDSPKANAQEPNDLTFQAQRDSSLSDAAMSDGDATATVQSPRSIMALDAEDEEQVDLRTFRAPSLLLPVGHLFGDWDGLRTKMEGSGITPSVTWVSDIAGNPTGGRKQGFTECENIGVDLLSDLNKICGIRDAQFHVSTAQRSGTSLTNEYIGNAFNVQQVYGGETFHLVDVEYIQRFCDNHISFHGGPYRGGR